MPAHSTAFDAASDPAVAAAPVVASTVFLPPSLAALSLSAWRFLTQLQKDFS